MLSRPMIDRLAFGPVSWYALLIVLGIALGYVIANREAARRYLPDDLVLDFLLLAIPLGIVGARLYYVFFRFSDYSEDLLSIFFIHQGGLAIYGGVLGGLLAARITARRKGVSLPMLLDLAAPSLVLAQGIGRWGNYINMEAYGLRVLEPELQFFPFAVEIPVGGVWYWHMATFFYEFLCCLAIFGLLLVIRRRKRREGDVFLWYLLLYAACRTVIEGLRNDSLTFISDFVRISQVFSGLIALGIVIAFFLRVRDRISAVTLLPLANAVLCIAVTFIGEFERNAYSFLFKYAQTLLLVMALMQIAFVVLWTLDCGSFDRHVAVPLLILAAFDLIVFLAGIGRGNADNTYYVSIRQSAAMIQLCLCGWLLWSPLCPDRAKA